MKKIKLTSWPSLLFLLLMVSIGLLFFNSRKELAETKKMLAKGVNNMGAYRDTMEVGRSTIAYLGSQLEMAFRETNKNYSLPDAPVYRWDNGRKTFIAAFKDLFNQGRPKLFVRYTEIGCNACADSTIKNLERIAEVRAKYEIIYLVDFTNPDAYLKWRKVTRIKDAVYWVEKNSLPFEMEHHNESYMFTIEENGRLSNFFTPNSRLATFITQYFKSISLS